MRLIPMLAVIQGRDLVSTLIQIVVVGLVFWLLWWLIGYCDVPEPFNKVLRVLLAIAAVVFLINVLLTVAGHPMIAW